MGIDNLDRVYERFLNTCAGVQQELSKTNKQRTKVSKVRVDMENTRILDKIY